MKYYTGESILPGDQVTYNGQEGCVALSGTQSTSGSPAIIREEWHISDDEILILFNNGARLKLDRVQEDELLAFHRRAGD